MRFQEERLSKALRVGDDASTCRCQALACGDRWERIERARGTHRSEARYGANQLINNCRALRKCDAHFLNLRGTARRQRLHDRWHKERRNIVGHLSLQLDEFLNEPTASRRTHVTDAPTGHRESFAHAVQGDGAFSHRGQAARREMLQAGLNFWIHQFFVNLITH